MPLRLLSPLFFCMLLAACGALQNLSPGTTEAAVVTGIASGSANNPGERMYVLRTTNGRTVTTTQVLRRTLKEGDKVEIERSSNGRVRIRE